MINLIVVTHGEFGAYLVEAAESIVGRQASGVRVISISARVSVPEIRARLSRALDELASPDGLVVLTDMPGGTPSNISFPLIKSREKVEMVTGINLYMTVAAFTHRDRLPLAKFVEKILGDGQKSIKDIRQMFLSGVKK
jgi:PTS system mannose-specific IIA component